VRRDTGQRAVARGAPAPLRGKLLDLRNSGDTAGDKARVVGYGAFAFTDSHGRRRLRMRTDPRGSRCWPSRATPSKNSSDAARTVTPHPALANPAASFVTLTQNGELRGCIGSLEGASAAGAGRRRKCGRRGVSRSALRAARAKTNSTRTRVEVSCSKLPSPMDFKDEADALRPPAPRARRTDPEHGSRRATFLPQVWESLPEPRRFMSQLKLKAGLPAYFWDDDISLARYGVQKWKET
jgi:AMMECR1 domain-containing protein